MSRFNHLVSAYRSLTQEPRPVVLATLIATEGSTYQKAGARMLIDAYGELTGILGGGCFEQDLIEHAKTVFASGCAKIVDYDMRGLDDRIWGLGLGCQGAVRIFLQLLRPTDDYGPLNLIVSAQEWRWQGTLVTVVESDHPEFPAGYSRIVLASSANHTLANPFLSGLPEKPQLHQSVDGQYRLTAFYDPLQRPLELLIIGAGPDALPLLALAKILGWRVTLIDHRMAHVQSRRFPQVDRLLHLFPQEMAGALALNHFQAAILMTHNADYDLRFLKVLASSDIAFIGLLGPRSRRERLLNELEQALAQAIRPRIYGPVGLDIGAETPEEIALSILSGIHAALNARNGGQLGHAACGYSVQSLPSLA